MRSTEGRVVSIYVSPVAGSPMRPRDEVQAMPERGLEGDRYFDGGASSSQIKPGREVTEVTLIEEEVIEHLRHDLGLGVEAADSRRNIVTRGVSLNSLVGSEFQVGQVRLVGAVSVSLACPSSSPARTSTSCAALCTRAAFGQES